MFSVTRLKCECTTQDAMDVLAQHLTKSRKLLDDEKSKGLIRSMQATLDILKKKSAEHMLFRAEYARDVIDLVKARELNVGPSQKKLQTIPYLIGQEKRRNEVLADESRRKKKKSKR